MGELPTNKKRRNEKSFSNTQEESENKTNMDIQ
jgi:hypothetical protein